MGSGEKKHQHEKQWQLRLYCGRFWRHQSTWYEQLEHSVTLGYVEIAGEEKIELRV